MNKFTKLTEKKKKRRREMREHRTREEKRKKQILRPNTNTKKFSQRN
jgi:hypothetical protein